MDKEEVDSNATPRSRRAKSASKATAGLKKFVTRRLAKSISSERDVVSVSSSEHAPAPSLSKRFSLRSRKSSKSRQTSHSERDAKPEAPRRSLSVSDMTQIANAVDADGTPIPLVPLEKEVKVPDFDDNEQFVQEILPRGDGPVPPETPVPEQRQEKRTDTRSSSSVNVSLGNDEIREGEGKMMADEHPAMEIADMIDDQDGVTDEQMEALIAEKVKEIGGLDDSPRAVPITTDGHVEVTDSEIKEVMTESLAAGRETTEERKEVMEVEEEEAVEPVTEMLDAAAAAAAAVNETSLMHEAEGVVDDHELDRLDEFISTTEKKTEKTRDFDLAELAELQKAAADVSPDETQKLTGDVAADEKALAKPKRRRRRNKIIKSASVSVAALAVGLLIVILKK